MKNSNYNITYFNSMALSCRLLFLREDICMQSYFFRYFRIPSLRYFFFSFFFCQYNSLCACSLRPHQASLTFAISYFVFSKMVLFKDIKTFIFLLSYYFDGIILKKLLDNFIKKLLVVLIIIKRSNNFFHS